MRSSATPSGARDGPRLSIRPELSIPHAEKVIVFLTHAQDYCWKRCNELDAALLIGEASRGCDPKAMILTPVECFDERAAKNGVGSATAR